MQSSRIDFRLVDMGFPGIVELDAAIRRVDGDVHALQLPFQQSAYGNGVVALLDTLTHAVRDESMFLVIT